MFAEAADIDRRELLEALRANWGIEAPSLRYEPVGFGSHHYVAVDREGARWFLTVNDLHRKGWIAPDPADNFGALERAFETACALRERGLGFVDAPVRHRDGGVLARVGSRYSLAVFGFIDGHPGRFDEKLDRVQLQALLTALGTLHGSTGTLRPDLLRRDTLDIPLRGSLQRSMEEVDQPWTGGPFSEVARRLVAGTVTGLHERLGLYDELAEAIRTTGSSWVITHGEPHPGNIMWVDASLVLIDWDTVAVGPPERDLWMVELDDGHDLDAYVAAGGATELRPEALDLYRLWWSLAEVALYVDGFRSEHQDDANTRMALSGLREYLPRSDDSGDDFGARPESKG
ncbi:MAG: phosphotransferase [Actinomycetota bacterium]